MQFAIGLFIAHCLPSPPMPPSLDQPYLQVNGCSPLHMSPADQLFNFGGRRHPARSLVTDTASYEIRRDQQPQDAQSQACPQRPKQPIIARKEQLREEKPLRDPSFTPATENSSYTLSARKPAKHAAYDTASSSNPFPYSQLFSDEESDGMESDDASRPPYYLMTPVRRQESFLETRVEGHQVATGKMGTVCEECLTSYSQGAEPRQRTADAGNKAV